MNQKIICRIIGHRWNHCKCERCGTVQNANHMWSGCRCSVCYSVRDQEHQWMGCQCKICHKTRNEEHLFVYANGNGGNAEQHRLSCKRCYAMKNEAHQWYINKNGNKRCSICGYTIDVCPKCGSFDTQNQEVLSSKRHGITAGAPRRNRTCPIKAYGSSINLQCAVFQCHMSLVMLGFGI